MLGFSKDKGSKISECVDFLFYLQRNQGKRSKLNFCHWLFQDGKVQIFWEGHKSLKKNLPFYRIVCPSQNILTLLGWKDQVLKGHSRSEQCFIIFDYFLQLMSVGLAWKSAAKSNVKLVYQKYATLFLLSWVPS